MYMQHKHGSDCTGFFKFRSSSPLLLRAANWQCSVSACTGSQIRCAYAITSRAVVGFKWCNAYRFVILVIGTVVYGRGDEQHVDAHKEQMADAHPHPHWHGNTSSPFASCFVSACVYCPCHFACLHHASTVLVIVSMPNVQHLEVSSMHSLDMAVCMKSSQADLTTG